MIQSGGGGIFLLCHRPNPETNSRIQAFFCTPGWETHIPEAWKIPTLCCCGPSGGGSPSKAIKEKRLFLLYNTHVSNWNSTAWGRSCGLLANGKRKVPHKAKGPLMQPTLTANWSNRRKSTDRTNVFVYGSEKQDCESTALSTVTVGTEKGDHIAKTGVFYYMKVLTIMLLVWK